MPKSRNRNLKKKKKIAKPPRPYEVIDRPFTCIENPISANISFDARKQVLCDIAKEASGKYESAYNELMSFLQEYDTLYLCSFCSYYFSTTPEGIDKEAIEGHIDFPDFYLEILQCLSLTSNRSFSAKPLDENIDKFKNTIDQFCQNQKYTLFGLLDKVENIEEANVVRLRTEIMGHTTAVRNWAYVDQMKRVAYDLAQLVESDFIQQLHFNPCNLLDLLFKFPFIVEEKLNAHIQKVRKFLLAKKYNDVFDKYEESFPHIIKIGDEARTKFWESCNQNLKTLKTLLMAHSDLFLRDIYTWSIDEITNYLSPTISRDEIRQIIDSLSYRFGDLSDLNKDHIFLNNPIHTKPFIKLDNNHYFSVIPHLFIHIGVDILEKFIGTSKVLQNEYQIRKGKYLEEKVEDLFRIAFPNSQIYAGSTWQCPNNKKTYENDLLIIVEDFAFIVECKSGTITLPARRGAPDRLFKTIKELIIAPSEQAIRFQEYLRCNKKVHKFKTGKKGINTIDSSQIRYYIPLGITLSFLGSLGCNLKKIINAKITNHTISELAPSISLTDLEIIFEILELRSEKIHYLSRRRELEIHFDFHGDELDLLGFYLENGFNIGKAEYDKSSLFNLTLSSKALDPYFVGTARGRTIKKPTLRKTKYWNDILRQLDAHATRWLPASYILLNLPKEDQIKFENTVNAFIKKIQNRQCQQRHNWMINYCGPEQRLYAIVGFPYHDIDKETRNNLITYIIESIQQEKNIRGIVVIGYNLNTTHYPYSVVAGNLETNFLGINENL